MQPTLSAWTPEQLRRAGVLIGPRINVVLNWFEELKERVPTRR